MDWQEMVALAIVAVTAGLFVRERFRPKGIGAKRGCGCTGASGGAASMPRILYRARKGERAQLIVMAQSAAGLGDAAEKEACRTR